MLVSRLGSTCVARVPAFLPCHGLQPLGAGVAEMADAGASQASGRKPVRVRIPPPARPYLACPSGLVGINWKCLRGVRVADCRYANESRGAPCSPAFARLGPRPDSGLA